MIKHLVLLKNQNIMDIKKEDLSSMIYNFFDKRSQDSNVNNEIKQNEQLAEDLHKPIIRKFKKRRVHSSFKENM